MNTVTVLSTVLTLSLSLFFYKKQKAAGAAAARVRAAAAAGQHPPPQLTHPLVASSPSSTPNPFDGLKVVELATVVAVPSATRVFAEGGASVIKVEVGRREGKSDLVRAGSGDPWRKFFLQYDMDKTRVFGSCFDAANAGKTSVQLDLTDDGDLAILHALLEDAHVFASNVRVSGLSKLGLDPATLAARHPHLIIAHLSAFGTAGVAATAPGYDIAAFWSCSGLAAAVSVASDRYSTYPAAFGDCTTGLALAAAVTLALPRQARTGLGVVLDSSLLASGCWANASELLRADEDARRSSGDGTKDLADLHEFPAPAYDGAKVNAELTDDAIGRLGAATADGTYVSVREGVTVAQVRAALALDEDATLTDVTTAIASSHSPSLRDDVFATVTYMPDLLTEDVTKRPGFVHHPLIHDLPALCASPVAMATGPYRDEATVPHRLARLARAPRLDEGGVWVRKHRCFPRPKGGAIAAGLADLSRSVVAVADDEPALVRATVLEVTRDEVGAVSLGGRQLADLGVGVKTRRVSEAKAGEGEKAVSALARHAGRGKVDGGSLVDLSRTSLSRALAAEAKEAAARGVPFVVLTDEEAVVEAAKEAGVNHVYVDVGPVSAEHSFFHDSGMSTAIAGRGAPLLPALPPGFVASILSVAVSLGVGQTILAATRRPREVHGATVSAQSMGTFVQGFIPLPLGLGEPAKIRVVMPPGSLAPMRFPVPTSNTFRTADGYRLMLLGVEMPRHLGRTMKALRLVPGGYLGLLWTVLTRVLFAGGASKLEKFVPIFEYLNGAFADRIGRLTLSEFRVIAEKHDVWYMPVPTAEETVRWCQTEVEDILIDGGQAVRSIVRIGSLY
jgi:crotonobetainyl-CoA:carnitine CoA-transferase CaiB-like acyl-CoA transferase